MSETDLSFYDWIRVQVNNISSDVKSYVAYQREYSEEFEYTKATFNEAYKVTVLGSVATPDERVIYEEAEDFDKDGKRRGVQFTIKNKYESSQAYERIHFITFDE